MNTGDLVKYDQGQLVTKGDASLKAAFAATQVVKIEQDALARRLQENLAMIEHFRRLGKIQSCWLHLRIVEDILEMMEPEEL